VTTNLRISLTVLSLGFAIEGGGEAYSLLTRGTLLPSTSVVFLFPAVMTLVGLLFLLVGRHEWSELHHQRVRRANLIFGLSLLGGFVAVAEVAVLAVYPGIGTPEWASVLFGMSLGSLVFGTFVTYGQLVFHLVSRPSKAVIIASLLWALGVSCLVGYDLAGDLPAVMNLIATRSLSLDNLVAPVSYLSSYLFLTYFLLLIAYVDAHVTVARGLPAPATRRGPGPARPTPSSGPNSPH
jgi:uncharacterized membrane protein YidH (DUF202 family)